MKIFKLRKGIKKSIIFGGVVLGVLYFPPTQWLLASFLTLEGKLEPCEAVLILGGGLREGGSLGKSTEERIRYGVSLYKKGLVKWVVVSGGYRVGGVTESEAMEEEAKFLGVPQKFILKEENSFSTYSQAKNLKKILPSQGKFILVTSPYHMRRAFACFGKEGLKVIPAPVKRSEIYTCGPLQNLRNLKLIFREFLALGYYHLKGYI